VVRGIGEEWPQASPERLTHPDSGIYWTRGRTIRLAFRDQAGGGHMTRLDGQEISWDHVADYLGHCSTKDGTA
jgi:hypothetical protein